VPEAVALFCERARTEPSAEAAELCRRLDSLPLAVELAAARTKALTPAQILERVTQRLDLLKGGRDADPRQQTLRATIEWSYDLLSPEERRLFARLAVFAGGCTLGAAEKVAAAELDNLQSLVEKSLLRFTNERYWMLETIREYAAERLDGSEDPDALRRRHTEHFLLLAEEAEPHAESDPAWVARVDAEDDNFRAALDRLEGADEPDLALRLAGALTDFWERGHVAEGRQRLERLLARAERPSAERAKALAGAAVLARQSGDAATAGRRAEEALALFREFGDARGAANATVTLGLAFADQSDFSRARVLFEEGIRLSREAGDEVYALFASRLLAWMHWELGEKERAWALYEQNLSWARALGNKPMEGQTLGAVAFMALEQGRADDAVSLLKDVLRIDRDLGARLQTSLDLTRFAHALAFAGGEDVAAATLLSCAEAVREKMGAGGMPYLVRDHEEALAILRTRLDDDVFAEAWQMGTKLTPDEAVELALGEREAEA
jgi:tetratricopeptide (TPR) repeat protein